ncbi:MAG: DJ-1/PfpI family protein [Actinobacteria bacterium]|nr:DJ-1/PfpI family protein [Actinomycetota bacterium]
METAILLYDRFTALDAVGPLDVLGRIPGNEIRLVGVEPGPVTTETGLTVNAEQRFGDVPTPDALVVPGGFGQVDLMDDGPLHEWLRAVHEQSTWTTSVCTGSLILAAAGILKGHRATSHWLALDQLPAYGVEPVAERVVFDGKIVTAAGVSSGIDMALALAARIAGDEVAQIIQLGIEYDPQPPFDAGSPDKAPDFAVEFLRSQSRFVLEGR